jgi:RNA polymerase sigma-70 factor (ECF subfamily)
MKSENSKARDHPFRNRSILWLHRADRRSQKRSSRGLSGHDARRNVTSSSASMGPVSHTSRRGSDLSRVASGKRAERAGSSAMSIEARGDASSFEAEVHELTLAGEHRRAAERLLARLSSELRAFLHRLLGVATLTDEALGATCEQLSRGLPSFRWESSVRAWSYIVARREAKRCRARHARRDAACTKLVNANDKAHVAPEVPTLPSAPSGHRDTLDGLRVSLSDDDRDLLVLRIERGLVWEEIAAAFLEEHEMEPQAVQREAARLHQRFRAIRVSVASTLALAPPIVAAPQET